MRVSEMMTAEPVVVEGSASLAECAARMIRLRVRHLPVVQDGRVVGMVSSGDLTHWLVKDQRGEIQELVDFAARS